MRSPKVGPIVLEHRDRLTRFGFELVQASLGSAGKELVVEEGEVLTSACGRLYGKRSAHLRAKKALETPGCA